MEEKKEGGTLKKADAPSQSSATWISDSINALGHDRRFLIG